MHGALSDGHQGGPVGGHVGGGFGMEFTQLVEEVRTAGPVRQSVGSFLDGGEE